MKKICNRKVQTKVGRNSLEIMIIVCIIFILAIIGVGTFGLEIATSSEDIPIYTSYNYEIKATLYGKDISFLFETKNEVDTDTIGDYTIEYVFKGMDFIPGFKKTISVKDYENPQITMSGEAEVHVYDIKYYEEPGVYAYDNVDGDLSSNISIERLLVSTNKYVIMYTCEDSSGNVGTANRYVIIDPKIGDVYLTFDDGPSTITESILQTLLDKNVKATFFVVGYDDSKKYIIDREKSEGHTIALHGLTHDYSKVYTSAQSVLENFDTLKNKLKDDFGVDTNFVRFIGGASNTISKKYCKGVMTESTQLVLENGYVYFDWNVDSQDAGGAKTAEEIYQNVINGIKPGRTNIVLMHDSSGHQATAEALEDIIDWCMENGYNLKPIDSNTTAVRHAVSN